MKKVIVALFLAATMAHATTNEITVRVSLKVNKDAVQVNRDSGTLQINMAGKRYNTQTLTLTTTNQYLSKGSVASAGFCFMRNLETNTTKQANVSLDGGVTTSLTFKAKEPALFRLTSAALVTNFTAAASSGTCDFEITVIED